MKPTTYGKEFFKKQFIAETMKEAYMKAVKWYATNVLSKAELQDVQVKFEKDLDEQFPTITIHLIAIANEDELRKRHCEICQEFHSLFYMSKNNCNKCEAVAYQKRADELILTKIDYYKANLNKALKE